MKELDKIELSLNSPRDRIKTLLEIKKNMPERFSSDIEDEDLAEAEEEKEDAKIKESLQNQYPIISSFLQENDMDWFNMPLVKLFEIASTKEEGQELTDYTMPYLLEKLKEWGFEFLDDIKVTAEYSK